MESRYSQSEVPEYTIECSECGHLHFNTKTRTYSECPIRSEGCTCLMDDTEAAS